MLFNSRTPLQVAIGGKDPLLLMMALLQHGVVVAAEAWRCRRLPGVCELIIVIVVLGSHGVQDLGGRRERERWSV